MMYQCYRLISSDIDVITYTNATSIVNITYTYTHYRRISSEVGAQTFAIYKVPLTFSTLYTTAGV